MHRVPSISTRTKILEFAERRFAEHGVEGISLRHLSAGAGAGNVSAVQYHFGSKDGLIAAIFAHRLPDMQTRRDLLVQERKPNDLRSWVGCQVTTVLQQSDLPGSRYLGFAAMVNRDDRRDGLTRIPDDLRIPVVEFHRHIEEQLHALPRRLRAHRTAQAMNLLLTAGADRERAHAHQQPTLPVEIETGDLIDGVVGFLEAAASPETMAAFREGQTRLDPNLVLI